MRTIDVNTGTIRCLHAETQSRDSLGLHLHPRNAHGIRSGYYRDVDIASLLRKHRGKVETILYIARQIAR